LNLIEEQEKTNDSFIGIIFDLRCTHAGLRCLSVEKDFFLSSMKTLDLCFDFDNDGLNVDDRYRSEIDQLYRKTTNK
jgi:hypothetical protein